MSKAISNGQDLPVMSPAELSASSPSSSAHPLTGALTPRMAPGALAALYHALIEAMIKRRDRA
jgi:hypothetical protein